MRLTDADTFAQVQGAEADRRRVLYAGDLECVHDGGPWCWRLTADAYPRGRWDEMWGRIWPKAA